MRVLTSYAAQYIARRLLSYLDRQVTTAGRRGLSDRVCERHPPCPALQAPRNRMNRPRTWVSDYTVRISTSDPSTRITGRLLNYLDHQVTTAWRRGLSNQECERGPTTMPPVGPRRYKSATCMSFGLHRAGLDIRSIVICYETPDKLSTSTGDESITSRSTSNRCSSGPRRRSPRGRATVQIGPVHGYRATSCGS